MSFVVQVWAQPVGAPLPSDGFAAQAQRVQLQQQRSRASPVALREFARALLEHFPPQEPHDPLWREPAHLRLPAGLVLELELLPASPRFEAALAFAIAQANALGLHLADGHSGIVHLADGSVIGEADEVLVMDALDAPHQRLPALASARAADAQAQGGAEFVPAPPWSITVYPDLPAPDGVPVLDSEPESDTQAGRLPEGLAFDAMPDEPALNPAEALRQRAEQGDARAAFELGLAEHSPPEHLREPDFEQAVYWFQRSADAGDPLGASMLGVCLLEGEGVPRDTVRARYWLERSNNLAGAQAASGSLFQLGRMLVAGWGGPAEPERGVKLYLRASALAHPDAIFNLASCLDAGYGCAPDRLAAKALFLRARALGSPLRAPGLRVSQREVDTVRALSRKFEIAADIPALLEERRVERALVRQIVNAPAAERTALAQPEPSALHAGHFALAVSLLGLGLLLALMSGMARSAWLSGIFSLAALAAWGTWRTLALRRHRPAPPSDHDAAQTQPG